MLNKALDYKNTKFKKNFYINKKYIIIKYSIIRLKNKYFYIKTNNLINFFLF